MWEGFVLAVLNAEEEEEEERERAVLLSLLVKRIPSSVIFVGFCFFFWGF